MPCGTSGWHEAGDDAGGERRSLHRNWPKAMSEIQNVLCPVDFSETSGGALRYAAGLAACWDAKIFVMHARSPEPSPYCTEDQIEHLVTNRGGVRTDAETALGDFVSAALGKPSAHLETVVVDGLATDAISIAAERLSSDLIVMGTHGRTGLRRFILGSIAEHTLHTTQIPVLMVRPQFRVPESGPVINDVLCPVNDTVAARRALSWAAGIAGCHGATLTLLHVKEKSPEHAISDLCSWAPSYARALCRVRELTREGRAAEEVLKLASEVNCDLLVVGAWHRALFDRTVIGCTTVPVVRHADCPVLIVPARASEETTTAGQKKVSGSKKGNFEYKSYGAE
jgi:nucleotide-binding universal stress UspA family protein